MIKNLLRKLLPTQLLVITLCYFLLSNSIRLILLGQEIIRKGTEAKFIPVVLFQGFFQDLHIYFHIIALYFFFALIFTKLFNTKFGRAVPYVFGFLFTIFMTFVTFSEWFFWDEFSSRFNFIAVDYLVYTNELIGNIKESYNMPLLLTIVTLLALILYGSFSYFVRKYETIYLSWKEKLITILVFTSLLILIGTTKNFRYPFNNFITDQLSLNGPKEFVIAFLNNRIDFKNFYKTLPKDQMLSVMKEEFTEGQIKLTQDESGRFIKKIKGRGPEIHPNVLLIMVESLSASFLKQFGNTENITPYLDSLVDQSYFFSNLYATGTRTVRGIEAVTLSVPPTPGQSVVRRPNSNGLFNIGTLFRERNYVTKFIYGGWGLFDNMNGFFQGNGFEIIDRAVFDKSEINFTTVWGVCDEDLFNKSMKEAEQEYKNNKPFFLFVLTTSNHRPYAFPEGKIDLKSMVSGRSGAVKYTDYSIMRFIEEAKTKKWFNNTVFVIMADHSASGRGKVSIPVPTYHIPLWIYAPKLIKPRLVNTITSEIDLAPTLFGLLNWNYDSYFLGHDVLQEKIHERFFSGTYQTVGMYSQGRFAELGIKNSVAQSIYDPQLRQLTSVKDNHEDSVKRTIAYYQYADWLLNNGLYKEETVKKSSHAQ